LAIKWEAEINDCFFPWPTHVTEDFTHTSVRNIKVTRSELEVSCLKALYIQHGERESKDHKEAF
jgi:hypothetical protein